MKDCLLISLPFSVGIHAPLLGLNILKAHAERKNIDIAILDLNYEYLTEIEHHGNINLLQFYDNYLSSLPLLEIDKKRIPSCVSAVGAFPYSFDEIDTMLSAFEDKSFWVSFLEKRILERYSAVPVVGVTIMGGSQVLLALLLAKLIKKRWPLTIVVAGGTHITLLKDRIIKDKKYGKHIDYFFTGHCEEVFAEFLYSKIKSRKNFERGILIPGSNTYVLEEELVAPHHRLPPSYDHEHIKMYNEKKVVFPIQLVRGCHYGRCRYCTFSAVEKRDKIFSYKEICTKIISNLEKWQPKKISLRDSNTSFDNMLIFGEIVKRYTPAIWRASTTSMQKFNNTMAKKLFESNCRVVEIGLETIHPKCQVIMGKVQDLKKITDMIAVLIDNGIIVQLNLMIGFQNETEKDAMKQLNWYLRMVEKYPNYLYGMLTMVQINHRSIFQRNPKKYSLILDPLAPWSSNYCWNAPEWRENFDEQYLKKNNSYDPEVLEKLLFM